MKAPLRETVILDAPGVAGAIDRLAARILEAHGSEPMAFVGIHTRGVVLADRLVARLRRTRGGIAQGTLDIGLYRDDIGSLASLPHIRSSEVPFEVEGATILLCDDVLFTGRTIRAAMNVLLDYGRPRRIELAVLADRGHRELPIAATWTGVEIPTCRNDYLRVHFRETDGRDEILHLHPEPA